MLVQGQPYGRMGLLLYLFVVHVLLVICQFSTHSAGMP